jgi:drug/metabolite transporter (DMT)-like permease
MLAGGNGGVVLAEQRISSGVAALLAASLALWMVLLEWLRPNGNRPTLLVVAGTLVGLAGVGVLVGPAEIAGARGVDPVGALLVLGGSLAWAAGSLLSRSEARPASGLQGSAMQMLCGGVALALLAVPHGDLAALGPPSARSLLAVVYLIVFGSLLGFTAYIWLMNHARPAAVASYAYVNPVVAVLLGWGLGGEAVSARMLGAAALIVVAVLLVTVGRARTG